MWGVVLESLVDVETTHDKNGLSQARDWKFLNQRVVVRMYVALRSLLTHAYAAYTGLV